MGLFTRLMRKKKRFIVFLARRGQRRKLGVIEASNPEEAQREIMKLLERYAGDEEVHRFSTIIVMDGETGEEVRFKNPLFHGEEDEVQKSSRRTRLEELAEALQLQLVTKIATTVADTMASAMKSAVEISTRSMMGIVEEAMKTPFEMLKDQLKMQQEIQKELLAAQTAQQRRGPSLGELASFIMAMVELAKNKDSVFDLLKAGMDAMAKSQASGREEAPLQAGGGDSG